MRFGSGTVTRDPASPTWKWMDPSCRSLFIRMVTCLPSRRDAGRRRCWESSTSGSTSGAPSAPSIRLDPSPDQTGSRSCQVVRPSRRPFWITGMDSAVCASVRRETRLWWRWPTATLFRRPTRRMSWRCGATIETHPFRSSCPRARSWDRLICTATAGSMSAPVAAISSRAPRQTRWPDQQARTGHSSFWCPSRRGRWSNRRRWTTFSKTSTRPWQEVEITHHRQWRPPIAWPGGDRIPKGSHPSSSVPRRVWPSLGTASERSTPTSAFWICLTWSPPSSA
mmetsp:Transcript_14588/g.55115  ORF Transcript_14588/g.55115 Transcript_14588/m.55115 type:complete len:281 (+) Transcript_14588:860-1702(+)